MGKAEFLNKITTQNLNGIVQSLETDPATVKHGWLGGRYFKVAVDGETQSLPLNTLIKRAGELKAGSDYVSRFQRLDTTSREGKGVLHFIWKIEHWIYSHLLMSSSERNKLYQALQAPDVAPISSQPSSQEETLRGIGRSMQQMSEFHLDGYTVAKTTNGVVIQLSEDYITTRRTGIYIPDDPFKPIITDGEINDVVIQNFKKAIDHAQAETSLRGRLSSNVTSFYDIYTKGFTPATNMGILGAYYASEAFVSDAGTVRAYAERGLAKEDANTIVRHREPVNIGMQRAYDPEKLFKAYGYREGAFTDKVLKDSKGHPFKEKPNTVAIYSETPFWKTLGDDATKIRVACLSLPAPAMDTDKQPHFSYYVQKGKLNEARYRDQMNVLASMVVRAAFEHQKTAFQAQGIQRVVISKYGQGAFLAGLKQEDRDLANRLFYETLSEALIAAKQELSGVEIALSVYGNATGPDEEFIEKLKANKVKAKILSGDIKKVAERRDLIINAWDPHSFPGNGNEGDASFDGAMGSASAIGILQQPYLNPFLTADRIFSM